MPLLFCLTLPSEPLTILCKLRPPPFHFCREPFISLPPLTHLAPANIHFSQGGFHWLFHQLFFHVFCPKIKKRPFYKRFFLHYFSNYIFIVFFCFFLFSRFITPLPFLQLWVYRLFIHIITLNAYIIHA